MPINEGIEVNVNELAQVRERRSFGFRPVKDDRDFQLTSLFLGATVPPPDNKYKYWYPGALLNQNGFPHCTAFGAKGRQLGSPIRQGKEIDTTLLYNMAQQRDEWEGTNYDGTSNRAVQDVLREWGYVDSYYFCQNMDELWKWLLDDGMLILGTAWTEGMDDPDAKGYIHPTGDLLGYHAHLLTGGYYKKKAKGQNSWGKAWGINGFYWITADELEHLVFTGPWWGEAIAIKELKK